MSERDVSNTVMAFQSRGMSHANFIESHSNVLRNNDALPVDCIVVLIDGDKLVTVRERGTGRHTQYTKR